MKKIQLKSLINETVKEVMGLAGEQINKANVESVIEREGKYASTPDGGMYDVCVLTVDKKAHFGYMAKFGDEWQYDSFESLKGNSNNGHQYFGADEVESVEPVMTSTGGPAKVRVHIKNHENVDLFIDGTISRAEDVKDDNKVLQFKVEKTGWDPNKKAAIQKPEAPEAPEPSEPMNENTIKKSQLKQIIREAISELMSTDSRLQEMWLSPNNEAEEAPHDETDLSNPEEKKEVQIGRELQGLVSQLLSMHGVTDEKGEEGGEEPAPDAGNEEPQQDSEPIAEAEGEEADTDNPAENEEVEIAQKIKTLANELLAMHGITDGGEGAEDSEGEEPEVDSEPINERRKSNKRR